VILHSINVMIEHFGFELDIDKLKEKSENADNLSDIERQKCKIEESII